MHAGAQENKTITLPEAIDLSIKNSHQLKSDKAKIEEATAALKESMEKERIVGPGRGLGEPVADLNLKEYPGYLKTERGTRLFVLL